ncbi:hypothetical protein FBEOM_14685 [Fusarium beomiforme]|uniref:Uncharacterized protein n=1 Tax=Fusarium beomiforme TaxID=44412 RepID=A0A9P5A414_9HYPO|nr:hypothetical protein FBEOM_14685 [Fusarium beomiforme]
MESCFPDVKTVVGDVLAHLQSNDSEAQREGVHELGIGVFQALGLRPVTAFVKVIEDESETLQSKERQRRDVIIRYLRMKLRLTSEEIRALDPIVRREREMLHPAGGTHLNICLRKDELDVFDTALLAKYMHWFLLGTPATFLQGWKEGQTAIRCLADIFHREISKFE